MTFRRYQVDVSVTVGGSLVSATGGTIVSRPPNPAPIPTVVDLGGRFVPTGEAPMNTWGLIPLRVLIQSTENGLTTTAAADVGQLVQIDAGSSCLVSVDLPPPIVPIGDAAANWASNIGGVPLTGYVVGEARRSIGAPAPWVASSYLRWSATVGAKSWRIPAPPFARRMRFAIPATPGPAAWLHLFVAAAFTLVANAGGWRPIPGAAIVRPGDSAWLTSWIRPRILSGEWIDVPPGLDYMTLSTSYSWALDPRILVVEWECER